MTENLNGDRQPEPTETGRNDLAQSASDKNTQREGAARRKPSIPSEEQCISALAQIPALMMTGLLNTAQASVTKGVYVAVLQHYRQPKSTSNSTGTTAPSLIDILQKQPSMIASLVPMLTQEQLREIQQQVNDANEAA